MNRTVQDDRSLEVRRVIPAPRERVFAAWTRSDEVRKWSSPAPLTVAVAEIDLRAGGRFRIEMEEPGGARHRAVGEYREVTPPERLVYTWSWEEDDSATDSLITVEFIDRGNETEVVLTHERLRDAASRDNHRQGWNGSLERLAALFAEA
ncbi:MAG TPA: SRPBCC domain-containing protein [Vicinamibacterales bacterium]|nr:SRPBCC domain-containing protein [Vicinamibacterales bacterium]